ncbi:sugar ABC transporter substrate-binding protein, partial [Rhizobium johnstonii]
DKLGVAGYGLVARKNAGNTPYRFMPQLWAYGGGVFDEATANPTYKQVQLDSPQSKAALSDTAYCRHSCVPRGRNRQ